MQRSVAITLGLLVLMAIPASATLLLASDAAEVATTHTYYLHATANGNAEQLVEMGTGSVGAPEGSPTMDDNAPTGAAPKATYATPLGNDAFRKNFLLAYWAGPAQGRVMDAEAGLFLVVPIESRITVSLFGDGGVGLGSVFASATRTLPAGEQFVTFDLVGEANVESEIVLSVSSDASEAGTAILYDAVGFASYLNFTLGDVIVTPPSSWASAPGWGPVTVINATAAHRETSLAISPVDPSLMIACAPSGVPNTQDGQSYFHVSRDAGATWDYMVVETGATDPRKLAFEGGDCDVAFDQGGRMYSADTWLGSLSVGSSTDGGHTWTGTPLAASAPVVDRPWLVGGPAGTVHVTWQDVQFGMPSAIWYSKSTDGGLTFTPAVSVTTANADGGFTWTGNLVVSPDQQSLYSVYTRRQQPAVLGGLDEMGSETVWVATSHDGGITWTQDLVAQMPNPASFLYPSLDMDAGGMLHVVFSSRTDVDRPIWYATSADQAVTWSAPIKVLGGVAGWSPWVVGGAAGEAAIGWYGTSDALGNTSATFDWYFYAAKAKDGAITSAGPTTLDPIFTGVQSETPEFNQIRLGADGKRHIGASAFLAGEGGAGWALFYQREL